MMITRIEIDGFKSLREFAVDLEPLTVFIGPNSAGKSNILDALALLSRLSSMPIDDAFKQGRGRAIDQFTRRGGEAGTTIRFAVEVFAPTDEVEPSEPGSFSNRYRYELIIERGVLASGAERLTVVDEQLRVIKTSEDVWLASHPALAGRVVHRVGFRALNTGAGLHRVGFRASNTRAAQIARERNHVRSVHTALASTDQDVEVRDQLSSYRLVHLDSARLREPSERIGSDTLASDASNLPTVLANLPGPTLGEIRADLVSLVPGVSSFEIVPDGDSFRIDFEFSGGERLPARLVSDGTLRILALLTALRVEPRSAMIGVEEPENGVYPGRLRKLVEYMQDGASLFPGAYEVAVTAGIDAPHGTPGGRAEKIAAAIDASWGACTLFVIHSDADGDAAEAKRERIEPGIAAARVLRWAERLHAFFGERVRLDALRSLPAFRALESDLVAALHALADTPQDVPPTG